MLDRFSRKKKKEVVVKNWEKHYQDQFTQEILEAYYYDLVVVCHNCYYQTGLLVRKGVRVSRIECPRCVTRCLQPVPPKEITSKDSTEYLVPTLPYDLKKIVEERTEEALARRTPTEEEEGENLEEIEVPKAPKTEKESLW